MLGFGRKGGLGLWGPCLVSYALSPRTATRRGQLLPAPPPPLPVDPGFPQRLRSITLGSWAGFLEGAGYRIRLECLMLKGAVASI